jgi:uncharacterized protein (TIGR02246 family)
MSTRKARLAAALVASGGLLASLGALTLPFARQAGAGDPPAAARPKADPPADPEGRQADRAAIQAQMGAFVKAFESGDADRVASFWTADGELIGDDGTVYRGRAAIAKAYGELFGTKEKRQVEVQKESLRFPSQDSAIEEGYLKVRVGKEEPAANRYSVLHVREGGKWLMALVREWPVEAASLHDLEWLIGTWSAKSDDTDVQTTYEWVWKKSFIRVEFTIRQKGRTLSGFQMIGKDAASGGLRTWTFESEGGFGEATWSRDGKRWVLDSAGRLSDGSTLAATNILIPLNADSFIWQSVQRSVDGEEVEDLAPVKVTRVKQKK